MAKALIHKNPEHNHTCMANFKWDSELEVSLDETCVWITKDELAKFGADTKDFPNHYAFMWGNYTITES